MDLPGESQHFLPDASWLTSGSAIGFGGIVFLTILDQAGKRYSNKSKIIWLLSITRAFLCLVLFTGISYAVNKKFGKNDDMYLFDVVKLESSGITLPEVPSASLISKVFPRSIAAFVGSALEHVAIARAFAVKNAYTSDQTQELCYYGVTNVVNSFFHSMGVGGAMSRTSVNSACKVKSPLSGIVTTAVILVGIYGASDVLYWIPKSTLAAIIITAVWPLIQPPSTFYRYWKTSLADFISSMIAFWVCLFYSTEVGLGAAVAFNIVYVLLRQVFTRTSSISRIDPSESQPSTENPFIIPGNVRVFRFNESFFFPNAHGVKTKMMESVQTHHCPAYSERNGVEAERTWSVQREKNVARLRKQMNITDASSLPPIVICVLDFTKCNHVDTTAVTQLTQFAEELKLYGGSEVALRFVGLSDNVRMRFVRARFKLGDFGQDVESDGEFSSFPSVYEAVTAMRRTVEVDSSGSEKKGLVEVEMVERLESPV